MLSQWQEVSQLAQAVLRDIDEELSEFALISSRWIPMALQRTAHNLVQGTLYHAIKDEDPSNLMLSKLGTIQFENNYRCLTVLVIGKIKK